MTKKIVNRKFYNEKDAIDFVNNIIDDIISICYVNSNVICVWYKVNTK